MYRTFVSRRIQNSYVTMLIFLLFFILSVLSGFFMYHSHFVLMETDLDFHWQRIFEVKKSLIEGHFFSPVALDYFHQSGSAVMTMYPKVNILPVVILSFFIKSQVLLFNISFILRNFFALIIAYLSSYSFSKDRKTGFLFSVTYVLSTMSLYYYIGVSALGTLSVITYLPLVLFGFLSLVENNNWIELSFGVSLILFSHLLSFGIVISMLLIWFLINIKKFKDIDKFISLLKSIITTVLLTSIVWIPFLFISTGNKMNIPTSSTNLVGHGFYTFLSAPLDNMVSDAMSFFPFVGLIIGFAFYRNISKYTKQMLWISLVFTVASSDLFPWSIASHTFIRHLQFPSRLIVIPQLLLCYVFAKVVADYIKNSDKRILITTIITFSVIMLQMGAQESVVNSGYGKPSLKVPYDYSPGYILTNNDDFSNVLYSKSNNTDYYPISTGSVTGMISNGEILVDGNKNITVKKKGNGVFLFNLSKNYKKVTIPFIHYNGIKYMVKMDGHYVKWNPDVNSLVSVSSVKKGRHTLQVLVRRSWYDYLSYVLSLSGVLLLLYSMTRKILIGRKNK